MVVAFLQFAVDINILNVETCEMLEDLIWLPGFNILDTRLILFGGYVFNFYLLLQIVHGVRQL